MASEEKSTSKYNYIEEGKKNQFNLAPLIEANFT
jgi:hypothetical protein